MIIVKIGFMTLTRVLLLFSSFNYIDGFIIEVNSHNNLAGSLAIYVMVLPAVTFSQLLLPYANVNRYRKLSLASFMG